MDEQKLKSQIGANLSAYRKRAGMTQAGLAEKLNYSDKAISKWERGESVPDVLILCQLVPYGKVRCKFHAVHLLIFSISTILLSVNEM